jgi:hypothetical protein
VGEGVAPRDAGVAEPRTHHGDVPGGPLLVGDAQRRMGEEDEASALGAEAQRVAYVLYRAVDRDEDGRSRPDAERGQPRPRPLRRGHHLARAAARPAVGEHDQTGALQDEGVVQRHQVAPTQVLGRRVATHDGGAGYVRELQVPDDGEPVRWARGPQLAAAFHAVDPLLGVCGRDREREGPPRQPRKGVVDGGQPVPRRARGIAGDGQPGEEGVASARAQRVGRVRELDSGALQQALPIRSAVVRGAASEAAAGRDKAQRRRHDDDGQDPADAPRCEHVPPLHAGPPVILSPGGPVS